MLWCLLTPILCCGISWAPLFQQSPRLHCQRLPSLLQYLPLSSRSRTCLSKEKQSDVQEVYDQYQISLDCNYGLFFLIWFIFMANTFGSTNSLSCQALIKNYMNLCLIFFILYDNKEDTNVSHTAMYSKMEMLPSPLRSAFSKISQRAGYEISNHHYLS